MSKVGKVISQSHTLPIKIAEIMSKMQKCWKNSRRKLKNIVID